MLQALLLTFTLTWVTWQEPYSRVAPNVQLSLAQFLPKAHLWRDLQRFKVLRLHSLFQDVSHQSSATPVDLLAEDRNRNRFKLS